MANYPMRVTEGQRDLILWLEDEKNFEYLFSVVNEKYQTLLEYHVGYLKYHNLVNVKSDINASISEEHGSYIETELEKVTNLLSLINSSKREKDNARGRSKK